MKLYIGVDDKPYAWGRRGVSTYDVALFLEARYKLFERFVDFNWPFIVQSVEQAAHDAVLNMMAGRTRNQAYVLPWSEIEDRFKVAISQREFDGRIPGVPTAASLAGVSHRRKHPYAKRGPRPSFRDTGTLQASLRAWFSEN